MYHFERFYVLNGIMHENCFVLGNAGCFVVTAKSGGLIRRMHVQVQNKETILFKSLPRASQQSIFDASTKGLMRDRTQFPNLISGL